MYNIVVKDEPAEVCVEQSSYEVSCVNAAHPATFRTASVTTQPYEIIEEASSINIENKGIETIEVDKCVENLKQAEFVNGFVIYELDSSTTTDSTVSSQSNSVISPTLETRSTPPTLLNAKLRKRKSCINTVTTTPAAAKQFKRSSIRNVALNGNQVQNVTTQSILTQSDSIDLKSKCCCHLEKAENVENVLKSPAESLELKQFFAKVFNETLQLTRKQQRAIKMELLEAVCQAEEDVDAGKLCENCCNNI